MNRLNIAEVLREHEPLTIFEIVEGFQTTYKAQLIFKPNPLELTAFGNPIKLCVELNIIFHLLLFKQKVYQ